MKSPTSSDKRLRLFENQWLEKLTVISVKWFVALWSCVIGWLGFSAWGSVSLALALPLIATGWLLFTMLEYTAHRFLFHWQPESDLMKQVVFIMHGNHHLEPTDKLRSLMPPVVSLPISLAVAGILELAFGRFGDWMLFGFVLGYVAYDLTHYASHQWPMRSRFGRLLKRHHMMHHFVSEEGNYAVTALFWDRVFGTKVRLAKRTPTLVSTSQRAVEPAE